MIPTANEVVRKYISESIKKAMIEFAKMHVKEALKQASENAEAFWSDYGYEQHYNGIDKDSILNAYPIENIK